MTDERTLTVFGGDQRLTGGSLREVLTFLKTSAETAGPVLVFEDQTGRPTDFDLSGTLDEVLAREIPLPPRTGPGRPKLGVTAREVTLLPRHWAWLEAQSGGVSATLRRLVDEARRKDPQGEQVRQAQASADRFLGVMAGDRPGYEEATRALYQRDRASFLRHTADWPEDVRAHALSLGAPALAAADSAE